MAQGQHKQHQQQATSEKKNKLRTSEDVYARIKWDTSFNQENFVMGYTDRFRGIMELPYVDYSPGGDIPFHRVHYFRNTEGYVWDRDTRLDLVFHSGEHHAQFSEEDIAFREDQMQRALKATAEADEEKREMADQKARKQLARDRQNARRTGGGSGESSSSSDSLSRSPPSFNGDAADDHSAPHGSSRAAAARHLRPRGVSTLQAFHFSRFTSQWIPLTSTKQGSPQFQEPELKVVTYNVLFDFYFPEEIHTLLRMGAAFELLHGVDADIIALQEVTPAFLASLLNEEWVQHGYCSSAAPGSPQLEPYGQVILSKIPIAGLHLYQFTSTSKTMLIAQMTVCGRSLVFSTLHLTSNHAKNDTGPLKRLRQLREAEKVLRYFEQDGAQVIIGGDFNSSDDDPRAVLTEYDDVWALLRTGDDGKVLPGLTFDPATNPLAKLNSLTGLSHRLDRIYTKNSFAGVPSTVTLIGTEPIAQTETEKVLYPSDHYGLLAHFQLVPSESDSDDQEQVSEETGGNLAQGSAGEYQPTPHTAIVIIPPREFWDQIEAVRMKHMVPTAMPHITLLFRFWPPSKFPEAIEMIEEKLASIAPFEVTLGDFGIFTHEHTCTAWARPDSEHIVPLQATIQKLFPECDEVTKRSQSKLSL